MTRMPALILAALIAAAPLGAAAAQERAPRGGPQRERSDERPRLTMAEAAQRAASGRQGRYLTVNSRGDVFVVRWEYPGGRVVDIMVDGRNGRVIGER